MERLGAILQRLLGGAAPDPSGGLDGAVRNALRAGVAGAIPRSDAWERLEGRIARETAAAAWSGALRPWPPRWSGSAMLALLALPRLAQFGGGSLLQ